MMSENMLMKSTIQFLLVVTPDNWRKEIIKKWIGPELLPVWTNAEDIFDDKLGDEM